MYLLAYLLTYLLTQYCTDSTLQRLRAVCAATARLLFKIAYFNLFFEQNWVCWWYVCSLRPTYIITKSDRGCRLICDRRLIVKCCIQYLCIFKNRRFHICCWLFSRFEPWACVFAQSLPSRWTAWRNLCFVATCQYENQISILGNWTNKGPALTRPKWSDATGKVCNSFCCYFKKTYCVSVLAVADELRVSLFVADVCEQCFLHSVYFLYSWPEVVTVDKCLTAYRLSWIRTTFSCLQAGAGIQTGTLVPNSGNSTIHNTWSNSQERDKDFAF